MLAFILLACLLSRYKVYPADKLSYFHVSMLICHCVTKYGNCHQVLQVCNHKTMDQRFYISCPLDTTNIWEKVHDI